MSQPSFEDIIAPIQGEMDDIEYDASLQAYADGCLELFEIEMKLATALQDSGLTLRQAVEKLDRSTLGHSFFAAWRLVEEEND